MVGLEPTVSPTAVHQIKVGLLEPPLVSALANGVKKKLKRKIVKAIAATLFSLMLSSQKHDGTICDKSVFVNLS
jgi:hypothetical protein